MGIILFGIVVVGSIIYAANMQAIDKPKVGNVSLINILLVGLSLLGILLGAYVVFVTYAATLPPENFEPDFAEALAEYADISFIAAFGFLLMSLVIGCVSIVIVVYEKFRVWISNSVIRSDKLKRRYNPQSAVHTTALVLVGLEILNVVGSYVLAGGIEGMAEQIAEGGTSIDLLLGNLLLNVLVALLGVGLFIRRDWLQTRLRLALGVINRRQFWISMGIGFAGFWLVMGVSAIWALLVTPEQLAAQSAASEQIFLAFSGSLLSGFILAATAAIGEEILFRGALQPIFGIFWTSIFFTLLHTQYLFTPASLVIFGVSVAFGLLRRRYNTTAAIIAHFIYNFTPFLLYQFISQVPAESLIP